MKCKTKLTCSVLLLVILGESYCQTTFTVNRTSTSWGYSFEVSDTQGIKVKHDDRGYHFEPTNNNTSSGLKKYYNSRTVYDRFTSPGSTNDRQSHSSTNVVNNDMSTGATYSTVPSASNIGGTPVTGKTNLFPDSSSNGPLFNFPTVPVYDPPNGPMYGPPSAPNYGPSSAPNYGPPSAPNYGPPSAPNFGPPSAPNYGPPSAPNY